MIYLSDFPYDFQALYVAMAHVFTLCLSITCIFCTGFQRWTGAKPYGDRAEIVLNCQSARNSNGARAASVGRSHRDRMVAVRSLCSFGHLCTKPVHIYISDCVVGRDGT